MTAFDWKSPAERPTIAFMDQDHTKTPPAWVEALARSDAELARGELVPAQAVHGDLRQALADMESELAEDS